MLEKFMEKKITVEQFPVYQIISEMNHINLKKVKIVSIGDNSVTIKEQHINGLDLRTYMQYHNENQQKINALIIQLLSAIEVLHLNGIIHRDIKPENIIISDNHLYLIDYDIARIHKNGKRKDTHILGTSGYAAPEQYGYDSTDTRSDIYALGVLLGELNQMYHLEIDEIVNKATMFAPDARYESIAHLRNDYLNTIVNKPSSKEQDRNHKQHYQKASKTNGSNFKAKKDKVKAEKLEQFNTMSYWQKVKVNNPMKLTTLFDISMQILLVSSMLAVIGEEALVLVNHFFGYLIVYSVAICLVAAAVYQQLFKLVTKKRKYINLMIYYIAAAATLIVLTPA